MQKIEFSARAAVSGRMQGANSAFRLDDWLVSPALGRIERGSDVRRVKPKSMEVLRCLIEARGAVVSRGELFDAIWPGMAVSDDVLTNCVVELRKAFDDSARDPKVIETIPKRGFRLVSNVSAAADGKGRQRRLRLWIIAITAAGLGVAAGAWFWGKSPGVPPATDKSIAVLPFLDMSDSKDQGYFADGLSEELINRLTQLDGLLVTGRTSSFFFKGRNDDLRSIGEQLSVGHVLEGSVRKSGEQLRVTAQLIDVSTGFHLWSDVFDSPYSDVFEIQEEIAESVATALAVRLNVGEMGKLVGGTNDVEAFEEFMLGGAVQKQFTAEAILQAIQHFKRATELDPGFALAWVRLGNAYRVVRLTLGDDEAENWQQLADDAIGRALSLAPNEDYVLRTAAYVEVDRQNWTQAQRYFDQLLADQPPGSQNESHAYLDLLAKVGKADEAVLRRERVLIRDPLHPDTAMYLGHLYLMQGRFNDAFEQFEAGMQLEGYRVQLSHEGLVTALASRQPTLATRWLDRVIEYQQPGGKGVHEAMRERFGDTGAALDWIRRGFENQSISDYYVIVWASYYQDYELAIAAMRRTPDLWAFWTPLTEPVRQTAAFKRILDEIGLVDYYREYGWNDYCRPLGTDDFVCR